MGSFGLHQRMGIRFQGGRAIVTKKAVGFDRVPSAATTGRANRGRLSKRDRGAKVERSNLRGFVVWAGANISILRERAYSWDGGRHGFGRGGGMNTSGG